MFASELGSLKRKLQKFTPDRAKILSLLKKGKPHMNLATQLKPLKDTTSLTLVLTCATAIPASADVSCTPGDMQGPPCSSAPATSSDSTAPGEVNTPPAAASVDFGTLAEMALHSLLSF